MMKRLLNVFGTLSAQENQLKYEDKKNNSPALMIAMIRANFPPNKNSKNGY
jgi:hypothetical protein